MNRFVRVAQNKARVLYQQSEQDFAEPALLIHTDNGGALVIEQEDRYITLNRAGVNRRAAEGDFEVKIQATVKLAANTPVTVTISATLGEIEALARHPLSP